MAKLPARSSDIAPAAGAKVSVDMPLTEHVLKGMDIFGGGAVEWQAAHFVVADEIDICAEPHGDAGKFFGVFHPVVHVPKQKVLQCDLAAGLGEVLIAGVKKLVDRSVLSPGNELAANLVIGCVQTQRERDGNLKGHKFSNGCGQADGGDGDPACTDAESPRCIECADCAGDGCVVRQRFTHAHEDDVRQSATRLWEPTQAMGLFDDLACLQIAFKTSQAGGAEVTPDGASDLAGKARGASLFSRDHHRFSAFRRCDNGEAVLRW